MNNKIFSDSAFIKTLKVFLTTVHHSGPIQDSIYHEAIHYFQNEPLQTEQLHNLQQDRNTALHELENNDKDSLNTKLKNKLAQADQLLKKFKLQIREERLARLQKIKMLANEIIDFCYGDNLEETNIRFAKVLGCQLLLVPTSAKAAVRYNHCNKHLYRAVLSLKLFDQLLAEGLIKNKFVSESYALSLNNGSDEIKQRIHIPLVIVSLLLDIGNFHPDAQAILTGPEGKLDELRALDNDERIALLKINYQQTINYITEGLGLDQYIGNSKAEKAEFDQLEIQKISFIKDLLLKSVNPQQGIGNVIKVPQIYTSIVMSSKLNFAYNTVPKAFLILDKGVERNSHSQIAVDTLLKITGLYPQGFGITYIPKDDNGDDLPRYEYAIVNRLYPDDPHAPLCRIVTKNLTFVSNGDDVTLNTSQNLYYPANRKKLEQISPERLKEILSKLWSNFEQRQQETSLIPSCWQPQEYFSYAKHQNLWNKTVI
ncbi:hypothetical protein [Pseudoalteromonas tunicata]|jgi:hypothetical protein|uniref:Uncharacterized protein n=1 Tax=Pseudoalteromonas tunicata D2 TaxID=87626 RepID=A4C4C1_9GAMM|nr:hypothetical protein [Pseudoalteromonas tunicata]ATC97115.1 hypothetical protein PTUN_b0777 [Pseudoalteromonas tunicata]AXT33223.1 hypothetical protein D1819_20655 [Pseudoalteromonas tunicata]EAR30403.1 hypothetical protein PTD2_02501 [Pseudoalteromonas tunicata D2]MDP4984802.1 hypothetical protein [Pseudoalteromonas tunicata]